MVHFDFIVTNDEAETIFSAITDEMRRGEDEILLGVGMNTVQTLDWWESRIKYLKELKAKMKNTSVPEHDTSVLGVCQHVYFPNYESGVPWIELKCVICGNTTPRL